MNSFKLVAAAIAILPVCQSALAADGPRTAPPAHKRYVGLDVGASRLHGGMSGAETSATSNGFAVRVGYQFSRFFALELGYADFGDFDFAYAPSANNCPGRPAGGCDITTHASTHGPLANVVALVPLNDRWAMKGRAGVFYASVASSASGPGAPVPPRSYSAQNGGLNFGAAVSYRFSDHLDAELGWATYEQIGFGLAFGGGVGVFDQGRSSLASAGIAYRF